MTLWPAAVMILFLLYYARNIFRGKTKEIGIAGVFTAVLVLAPLFHIILPQTNSIWLSREVEKAVSQFSPFVPDMTQSVVAAGYHEPSLVFLCGTQTRLVSPGEAAESLLDGPNIFVIISVHYEKEFKDKLDELYIQARVLKIIKGYNYSTGRREELKLYARDN